MSRARGLYDQEVRFTDQELGRLFEGLHDRGVLENAVVAIAGDHGESLWDNLAPQPAEDWKTRPPKLFFHAEHDVFLRESLLKTPLILWGTGVEAARIEIPVENVDLFPTLIELSGLEATGSSDGRSLVPFLAGRGASREHYSPRVRQHVAVFEPASGLKLSLPTDDGNTMGSFEIDSEPSLHDLSSSPFERENLYASRPEDVARLRAAIIDWSEAHPTEIHLQREKDPETIEALRALGYLGEEGE